MRSEAFEWFVRGVGLAIGALAVLAVAAGLLISARVVALVFIALVFAAGLEPIVVWLRNRLPLNRSATIIVVYAAFFVIVVGLAFLIVPGALTQFDQLGSRLAPVISDARAWAETIHPRGLSASLTALLDAVERAVVPARPDAPDPDDILEVGITAADIAISALSVLALVFFWLTGRARLQRFVLALLPARRRHGTREAWNDIEHRLGRWVRAQALLMGSMGVITTVAYAVIGLEGPLLLGVIAALAEAIPLVGPALGAIPALLVAALTGQFETVLLVAGVYIAIQVFEGNVLVPLIMRRTLAVPPFLVVAGVLAGATIAGVVGALLAVPLIAAILAVLERLQAREHVVPAEPATPAEGVPHGEDDELDGEPPIAERPIEDHG
ncbi:MAG: AI-2E family transporter [Chloroflexota bacterium]|nr:AI-2E family transporter [Chloroflexota bacterium]